MGSLGPMLRCVVGQLPQLPRGLALVWGAAPRLSTF